MSGEIKHEWSGTILTVISDSGASSADLKGEKGDRGPRGPQGPAGLLLDEQGNVKVDLSPYDTSAEVDAKIEAAVGNVDLSKYATKAYVIESVENIDLDEYATKNYVSTEIAQAQLSGGGGSGSVDLSGYATKDDLNNYATKAELDNYVTPEELVKVSLNIDNKTIKANQDGSLRTAIGGAEYTAGNLVFSSRVDEWVADGNTSMGASSGDYIIGSTSYNFTNNHTYYVVVEWADGTTSVAPYLNSDQTYGDRLQYVQGSGGFPNDSIASYFYVYTTKTTDNIYFYMKSTSSTRFASIAIYDGPVETVFEYMDARFIPVDGTTIAVNAEGKLTSLAGSVSFDNYYTKSEIDALLASIETYPSAEEVLY